MFLKHDCKDRAFAKIKQVFAQLFFVVCQFIDNY